MIDKELEEVLNAPEQPEGTRSQRRKQQRDAVKNNPRNSGYTITQIAEVMSHVMMESIGLFNKSAAAKIPEEQSYKRPEFELNIVPVMLSPEEYMKTGIESRAFFTMELKQFGSKSIVYRDSVPFRNERERKNVNSWLPSVWQRFFQYMMENSLLYILALNPDDPEVKEELTKEFEGQDKEHREEMEKVQKEVKKAKKPAAKKPTTKRKPKAKKDDTK